MSGSIKAKPIGSMVFFNKNSMKTFFIWFEGYFCFIEKKIEILKKDSFFKKLICLILFLVKNLKIIVFKHV